MVSTVLGVVRSWERRQFSLWGAAAAALLTTCGYFIKMSTSLTPVGLVWAVLSLVAALLCCTGFYLPYWIQGRLIGKVDAHFSSFRRCNYPRLNAQGVIEIVLECGRYSRFRDIPSAWWQLSTVLTAAASVLSLLIAVTALAACCVPYVVYTGTARTAGLVQLVSGAWLLIALLICGGGIAYPAGWDNREVRDCCGENSGKYRLGACQLSWSAYQLCCAVLLLALCAALSLCASRHSPSSCMRV